MRLPSSARTLEKMHRFGRLHQSNFPLDVTEIGWWSKEHWIRSHAKQDPRISGSNSSIGFEDSISIRIVTWQVNPVSFALRTT
jgi:hypothetical protein